MDDIEEIKAGELQKLETNCRDCMLTLRPKSEQELGYPPSISVIPVNLDKGINLFTRKTENFECLMEILSQILSHKECEDSKFPILAVTSECQGKISYEWLSRGTIDPKVSYKVYPSNENITLSYIKDDPLSFSYSLAKENQEDANSDCADSISSEEDKEEAKVSMDTLRRGSIITSIEEERVNLSQKLMVEFELFSNATIVTKGFIFDLLLHSAHYEATIASLDGIVRYKDDIENPTGIPERVYKKSPIKMVKSGDIFV